ncbi:MAG: undecaprenyldiphospho-muramoylpentapeptide beta-N-acetylglucosaminyltransferase [Ignavibacteriaceae bacterium]|nr:undecaprenyldiphospho-muramoylpentapeptide beta-N-acetylglucosaminyltransferase [Ignavibacteriaceae bacterium]
MQKNQFKFLFAGGGTGGHLFPAIAVAEKIKAILPEAEILFVGTKSRIEGKLVPKLGFNFKSIWIKGFSRKLSWENLLFPLKLFISVLQSLIINLKFQPSVAIGTGGYVAGPAILGSAILGAKIILIEQNSLPGITTKLLQRYADEIHLSYDNSKQYLKNGKKLFLTGNPVRENLVLKNKSAVLPKFGLAADKKTLLILGGSLGASSLNTAVASNLEQLCESDIQIIWQTGRNDFEKYKSLASNQVWISAFIEDMNEAYSACTMAVARAGATSIAEILFLGIPSILVPSPNVAENHQYYNAKSLADQNAVAMINDSELNEKFFEEVKSLIFNNKKLSEMSQISKSLSKPEATNIIANRAINYAKKETIN